MINWSDLETINEKLGAFNTFDVRASFGEGRLENITAGVKANIAVDGLPWTAGLEAYRNRVAEKDADAVSRLRAEGAAIVGISNMEEAALGAKTDNPFFGATQNPHKTGYTAGGSSGGSAAAVASGMCDIALGSDTMGSVRVPAAYCGIYGLKPSQGAISQDGLEICEASLDCIGPMARSLDKLETTSRILMEFGYKQPIENVKLLENLGDVECEPAVLTAYETACERIGAVQKFTLPYPLTRVRYAGFILSSLSLSNILADVLQNNPEDLSDNLKKLLSYGAKRSVQDLAEDREILKETKLALNTVVENRGSILLPTTPQAAFDHDNEAPANQADFTCLANISGLPAITVPAGWNEDGLPVAVQVIGAQGNEGGLFDLARRVDNQMFAYGRPEVFLEKI